MGNDETVADVAQKYPNQLTGFLGMEIVSQKLKLLNLDFNNIMIFQNIDEFYDF